LVPRFDLAPPAAGFADFDASLLPAVWLTDLAGVPDRASCNWS